MNIHTKRHDLITATSDSMNIGWGSSFRTIYDNDNYDSIFELAPKFYLDDSWDTSNKTLSTCSWGRHIEIKIGIYFSLQGQVFSVTVHISLPVSKDQPEAARSDALKWQYAGETFFHR